MKHIDLSKFDNSWYDPGRPLVIRALWYLLNALFLKSHLNPSSGLKLFLMKLFGAKVGKGVVVKPGINIKYPWNLEIGDSTWIGESAWLDSLAKITISNNVCISQGVYLCTGNHDYAKESFDLILKPIDIEDGVWLGARAVVCPGVALRSHSVVAAGSVVTDDTEAYTVYQGNPAKPIRKRAIS